MKDLDQYNTKNQEFLFFVFRVCLKVLFYEEKFTNRIINNK